MKSQHGFAGAIVLWLLLMGAAMGHAQEITFAATDTPTEAGFSFSLTGLNGIDDVQAVAGAIQGAILATGLWNQAVIGNLVEERDAYRSSLIRDSFQDNRGIVMVNQETGNLNNQANVRVLAFAEPGASFQSVSLAGTAVSVGNTVITNGGAREDRIANSFGGTVGIVGVNQSAGNLNIQLNALVLGVGVSLGLDGMLLGESALGTVYGNNTLVEKGPPGPRTDVVVDSFGGFRGIAQINQSAGDLNIVRNVFGLSVGVADFR